MLEETLEAKITHCPLSTYYQQKAGMLGFKPFKHSLNFHSRHWEKDIFLYNGMALNIFCPKNENFQKC